MQMNTSFTETRDLDSRLVDMTLGEALEIASPFLSTLIGRIVKDNLEGKGEDEIGYGIAAIREVFDCGDTKAVDIHHDRRYAKAFYHEGRKIVVNKTILRRLMFDEQNKRK